MTGLTPLRSTLRVAPPVAARLVGAVAQVGVQVLAARLIGLWAVAVYGSALAWTRVAGNAVAQGYPSQVMRDTARLDHGTGLSLRAVLRRIGLGTLALSGLALVLSPLLVQSLPVGSAAIIAGLVAAAGSYAGLRCLSERTKAAGAPALGLFFEFVLPPAVVLVVVAVLAATDTTTRTATGAAIVVASISLGYLAAGVALALDGRQRFKILTHVDPPFNLRLAVIGIASPSLGAIPLLVAPAFVTIDEVAWLTVGLRLVAIPTLVFAGLAAYFAPRFSSVAAQADHDRLRLLFNRSQIMASAVYVPAAVVLMVKPQFFLSMFGIEAAGASTLLRILVFAQATNAVTGLTSEFLTMTHNESREFTATTIGSGVALVAVIVGGLLFGVNGVAAGFGLALAVRFGLSWLAVRQSLYQNSDTLVGRSDQVAA